MALPESVAMKSLATDTDVRDRWRTAVGLICPTAKSSGRTDADSSVHRDATRTAVAVSGWVTVGQ